MFTEMKKYTKSRDFSRNSPAPLKRQRVEDTPSEIPDVLQGEIARLDQRFKVRHIIVKLLNRHEFHI